jgi:hypothetical protein
MTNQWLPCRNCRKQVKMSNSTMNSSSQETSLKSVPESKNPLIPIVQNYKSKNRKEKSECQKEIENLVKWGASPTSPRSFRAIVKKPSGFANTCERHSSTSHSLTYSPTYPLTYSLTHLLTRSLTNLHIYKT